MDLYAVSDTFLDDFSSALVLKNTTTVLPFSGEGEDLSRTLLEDLSWHPDIAMAEPEANQTQPLEDSELHSGFTPQESGLNESESRTVPQDFELPPELAPTAFELNPELDSMPFVNTPGFVALQTSESTPTFVRRPRKPREYVPRPEFLSWLTHFRKFKRENQIVWKGNNKTGREGKLRCDLCRKRHSKVYFRPLVSELLTAISAFSYRWICHVWLVRRMESLLAQK